jgi:3-oxoadipate enol-lactonase
MRDDMRPETKKQMEVLLGKLNVDDTLARITAPTLIITSDRSALQTVDTVLRYKSRIANSRLLVLSSDAYHVAVANADECVTNVLTFFKQSVKS